MQINRRAFLAASSLAPFQMVGGVPPKTYPGYLSPIPAMAAPKEKFLFVTCSYSGMDTWEPDYLATVSVDKSSLDYSSIVSRVCMPVVGDELFRFGWNVCSSSHKKLSRRQFLVLPGMQSGRINIVDVEVPERLWMHKVVEATTILDVGGFSVPYTARPLPSGEILVSMLGDRPRLDNRSDRHGPGFLLLDEHFAPKARWDSPEGDKVGINGDFWYQAGAEHPVMIGSAWCEPRACFKTFSLNARNWWDYVKVWNWKDPAQMDTIKLGADGKGTLPVRFLHKPTAPTAFVAAAISGTVWRLQAWNRASYKATKVISVDPVEMAGRSIPALTTDMIISMNDRFLYISNWLHGDVRQYDLTDPEKPKLADQIFLGGQLGRSIELDGKKLWGGPHYGEKLWGGPQSLQLSLDGRRLYVTNSFFSAWDNRFYPEIGKIGSWMMQIDCDPNKGGMKINGDFFVDFGKEPCGPSRAREIHCDGGDCTSDIFV